MPAPPSTKQKEANARSMAASRAASSSVSMSKTGTGKMGAQSSQSGGVSRSSAPSYGGGGKMGGGSSQAVSRAFSGGGISTPYASGSPRNNPTSINITPGNGSLRNAMTQRQFGSLAPTPGNRVTDVYGPSYAMDASIAGRLAPKPAVMKDQSRLPQEFTRSPNYGEALQNALVQQQASIKALNAARANPNYGSLAPAQAATPEQMYARAKAVSRGPGAVAGVMPGAGPLSQQRTLQTLAGSMSEDPQFGGRQFTAQDLQGLARTIPGEAGRESPMGQTAVANTMVNRMALAAENAKKYGYMGGADINKLMGQYDATGMRGNLKPNAGFRNAELGTDSLGTGIASLAGALGSQSQFNQTAPAAIKNATHFFNPDISNPKWGRQGFTELGNHTFGNAEPTAAQVASLRGGAQQPGGPTQVASINPAMAPPAPQQGIDPTTAQPIPQAIPSEPAAGGGWLSDLMAQGGDMVNAGYDTFTDANKKINAIGGPKVAVALATLFGGFGGGKVDTARDNRSYETASADRKKTTSPEERKKEEVAAASGALSFNRKPPAPWTPPTFMNPAAPAWNRSWNA